MADIVIATAILAFTFFYMSIQPNLAEWSRRFFQVFGFMTILLTIGIEMTASSETFMTLVLWIYSIAFVTMTLIEMLLLVVDALSMISKAAD